MMSLGFEQNYYLHSMYIILMLFPTVLSFAKYDDKDTSIIFSEKCLYLQNFDLVFTKPFYAWDLPGFKLFHSLWRTRKPQ